MNKYTSFKIKILAVFDTIKYIWLYGINGAGKKLDQELYKARMEYWEKHGELPRRRLK